MILILDISNLMHRAFHALPPLTAPDGTPTNAVYGLCKTINAIRDRYPGAAVVAALDEETSGGVPTVRRTIWPTYKTGRKPKAPELLAQIPVVYEVLAGYGIPGYVAPGLEADDVMATLAEQAYLQDEEAVVVSGDKDMLQLITNDGRITVLDPKDWTRYHAETVRTRLGILPGQMVDYLALVGDSADAFPGCPGIGPKRACDLLGAWGTLERVFEVASLGELPKGVTGYLEKGADLARISKDLATARRDARCEPLFAVRPDGDLPRLAALFERLGIRDMTPTDWGSP